MWATFELSVTFMACKGMQLPLSCYNFLYTLEIKKRGAKRATELWMTF